MQTEMKSVWIEIQKAAGQFEGYSDADITVYFEKTFLYDSSEIDERCFFLKDNIEEVYLHTQPESYQAIKLYNDFGFNITKEDSYGHAVNEYGDAIEILKEVMNADAYKRLINTAVQ